MDDIGSVLKATNQPSRIFLHNFMHRRFRLLLQVTKREGKKQERFLRKVPSQNKHVFLITLGLERKKKPFEAPLLDGAAALQRTLPRNFSTAAQTLLFCRERSTKNGVSYTSREAGLVLLVLAALLKGHLLA